MSFLDKTGLARLWANILALTDSKVSSSRTVNGKPLSDDITLTYTDVGADESGSASLALDTAKSYTDSKTANLVSATVVDNKVSSHNTSTSAHNDIRVLITDLTTKLNNFLDVDDTTTDQLSEVLTLIENNKGTLESLTTSKVNVSDIINNLTTNSSSKVLSAAQGVAIKSLIDALQESVDTLQEDVDGKADSNHNHDSTYLKLSGGDITGNLSISGKSYVSGISQNGRVFNNVASCLRNHRVDEIVIKTKFPFVSASSMPSIHLRGFAYGIASPIELTVAFYIYNNAFYSAGSGVTSTCPWKPDVYLSSYTENGTKYVAVNLCGEIYYPLFVVDVVDLLANGNVDRASGWTIETKRNTETTSIMPTDDLMQVSYRAIANDITGNAATATSATTAETANTANTATKATQDASGNVITSTYETKTDADGKVSNLQTQINNKLDSSSLNNYYTKTEIENLVLITTDDIDAICGTTIQIASEEGVVF